MKELKAFLIVVIVTGAIYWGVEPYAHSVLHPHVEPANFDFAKEDVNLVVMFCLNKSPGTRNAYKHAVNYKRNYIYYAIETGEITIGIKGRHYTSMTIEEYKGGCEDWLEHVLKFI